MPSVYICTGFENINGESQQFVDSALTADGDMELIYREYLAIEPISASILGILRFLHTR